MLTYKNQLIAFSNRATYTSQCLPTPQLKECGTPNSYNSQKALIMFISYRSASIRQQYKKKRLKEFYLEKEKDNKR
jgi:hypothetical protein